MTTKTAENTPEQAATIAKIMGQIHAGVVAGAAKYHETRVSGEDVFIFADLTRAGETRCVSFRVRPDGQVSTHIINTFRATGGR